jgi:hypothetical protein
VLFLTSCSSPDLADNKDSAIDLLSGGLYENWHLYLQGNQESIWSLEDGLLVCDPSRDGIYGDLVSNESFENYRLTVEWKIDSAGNSGIFLNVQEDSIYPTAWASAPEYQLLDDYGIRDHNYGDSTRSCGTLYGFAPRFDGAKFNGANRWNTTVIEQEGSVLRYKLNGIPTAEVDLSSSDWKEKVSNSRFAEFPGFGESLGGRIGLQAWSGKVTFRSIKIEPIL